MDGSAIRAGILGGQCTGTSTERFRYSHSCGTAVLGAVLEVFIVSFGTLTIILK